jgi:hypothetical protein
VIPERGSKHPREGGLPIGRQQVHSPLDTVNQCLWRRRDAEDEERILSTPKAFAVLRC